VKVPLSKELLIEEYITNNLTSKKIGEKLGYSESAINYNLIKFSIPRKKKNKSGPDHPHWVGTKNISGKYFSNKISSSKTRNLEYSLENKYNQELLEKQNFKCKISGLYIPFAGIEKRYDASLDRIDNNKGYIVDNVQWLHKDINDMKGKMTDEHLIKRCHQVSDYQKSLIKTPIVEVRGIWAEDLFKWFYEHVSDSCGDGCGVIVCQNYKECADWFIEWWKEKYLSFMRTSGYQSKEFPHPKDEYSNIINYHNSNENFAFTDSEDGWHNNFDDYIFIVKSDLEFGQDKDCDRRIKAV
jgi:hypothetical protein